MLIGYDATFNEHLEVGKDVTILGRLNVKNFTNQNIINTTTNNYQLIVSEDLSLNGRMYVKGNVMIGSGNEPSYLLDVSSVSSQPFRVGVGATNALVVNSSGFVGIGTTNPTVALDVNGDIRSNNLPKYWNHYRLSTSDYTASSYLLLGALGDYNNGGNMGSINIKGTIGNWTTNKANIDMTISSTGATSTSLIVLGSMNSKAILSDILSYCDIVGYYQGGTGSSNGQQYKIYLKINITIPYFNFTVTGSDGRSESIYLAEPSGTAVSTTGTLLSGTPSLLSALQQYTIGGNVGIGKTNPSSALDVVGNVRCTAGYDLNYSTVPTYASNQIGCMLTNSKAYGSWLGSTSYCIINSSSSPPLSNGIYIVCVYASIAGGYIPGNTAGLSYNNAGTASGVTISVPSAIINFTTILKFTGSTTNSIGLYFVTNGTEGSATITMVRIA